MIEENSFQLLGFCICQLVLLGRVIFGFIKEHDLTIIIPGIIVAVSSALLAIVIAPLFRGFGWKIFHVVGIDPTLISKSFNSSNILFRLL